MMIAMGLGIGAGGLAENTDAPELPELSLTDFSRDRVLFDSGFAIGANLADIALSGTSDTGEVIEARALSVDDGGASSTGWSEIATVDAGGNWSGQIQVPRSASWYRAQVRVKSTPVLSRQSSRFGVGHVVAIWGQSEDARFHSSFHNTAPVPGLLHQDAVQYMYFDAGVQHTHISDATPVTASVAAMANTFLAERPQDKFAIVSHAVAGTDPRGLVDDTVPSRNWADDLALHQFATADGQKVGLASWSWFAAPGSLGTYYEEALFPLFTGLEKDGTVFAVPGTLSYNSGSTVQYDHVFSELYDPAHTRWAGHGPHRFEITETMQDATHLASGAEAVSLLNKQRARESWRNMLANPNAGGIFLPYGIEMLAYQNGQSDGAGGWQDSSHPDGNSSDGLPLRARLTAHAVMQAAGMVGWAVPEFDNCSWSSDFVEVWSSVGPITTTRLARGEPVLDGTHPHWTDVAGWQINGAPAERAEIIAGRVRIYPNGGGSFTFSDQISYGEGGATGMIVYPDDHIAQLWKNIPLVDVDAAGVEGIALRSLPDPAVLANTLSAPQSFDIAETGPYFRDPSAVGTGHTGLTMEARLSFSPGGTSYYDLFQLSGSYMRLEARPHNGRVRLQVRDSAGTIVVARQEFLNVIPAMGTTVTYRFVLNHTLGWARLYVDDVLALEAPFSVPGTGLLPDNRMLQFFKGQGLVATVRHLRAWKEATSDGSAPISPPYKEIIGGAAAINADPWKLGTDAV